MTLKIIFRYAVKDKNPTEKWDFTYHTRTKINALRIGKSDVLSLYHIFCVQQRDCLV